MRAYYNEFDPFAAAWLRGLIKDGRIADGDVDERSITEVSAADLKGYTQCHFFAGIGGWSYALRLAGWPDSRPVWTGSCPCQPFSAAGKREGNDDRRHLWPEFFRLIRECRAPAVFGEQVEAAIRHGWLDGISADLEGEGYSVGAHVLGAHSVGAPHIRQRLYWVAYVGRPEWEGRANQRWATGVLLHPADRSGVDRLANSCGPERREEWSADGQGEGGGNATPAGSGKDHAGGMDVADFVELRGEPPTGQQSFFESGCGVVVCRDGKGRRIPLKPGLFPLADGLPGRVGLLRGAGNAIVPQLAAEFIQACEESRSDVGAV